MKSEFMDFLGLELKEQIQHLYRDGEFIVAIRYYGYKINLYLFQESYLEVFYNHKLDQIEAIKPLDFTHSRMKFYQDQIALPSFSSTSSRSR